MDRLKRIKDSLTTCVEAQTHNLKNVDTKELGAAIDMIKDLEEAIYYCTITKAMNEPQQKGMMSGEKQHRQMEEPMYYGGMNGDNTMYRAYYGNGRMYNTNGGSNSSTSNMGSSSSNGESSRYYHDMRDPREGRSPMYRMMYMENKHNGNDSSKTMKNLEDYMHELTEDITEMIEGASPEEKQMLRQKISLLAGKIK